MRTMIHDSDRKYINHIVTSVFQKRSTSPFCIIEIYITFDSYGNTISPSVTLKTI